MIRHGKDPSAALRLQRHAGLFKEIHHGRIVKSVNRTVEELGISHHIVKKLGHLTGVCQVTPPLPRDKEFLPKLFISLY